MNKSPQRDKETEFFQKTRFLGDEMREPMTQRKQKLEFTWIGKEQRPRLEQHILWAARCKPCVRVNHL